MPEALWCVDHELERSWRPPRTQMAGLDGYLTSETCVMLPTEPLDSACRARHVTAKGSRSIFSRFEGGLPEVLW